jgi:microcin C transport system permease protein
MLGKIIYLIIVLAVGAFLTRKVIPGIVISLGRLIGFRMKATPITRKRLMRFKSIKRGYWSFLGISILFVTSLFLELIVNEKPLYIRYRDQTSYPALRHWVSLWLPFKISTFTPKSDFGQAGKSGVDFHLFKNCTENPDLFLPQIEEAKRKLERAEKRFKQLTPPKASDSEFKKDRFKLRKKAVEVKKRQLAQLKEAKLTFEKGDVSILETLYPWSPTSFRTDLKKNPPNGPSLKMGVPLGTTPGGRDILTLLLYGFRISLGFALVVAGIGYFIGIIVGGLQGYYGGWVDIISQRVVEIWGSIPFLFMIMIIASMMPPTFIILALLLIILRSWLGITFYIRGEFYREKSKDYVQAAIASGVSDWSIITKHILPNSLVPVVTFAPFGIVAFISSLVSLDYLGFGLPPGTPSWGGLIRLGLENLKFHPYMIIVPVTALCATLFSVVMVGEAVREAFDPKVFSRLR